VFLAVILDAYSRRVIGWALDRTIEDSLTLAALRIARRSIEAGMVQESSSARLTMQAAPPAKL